MLIQSDVEGLWREIDRLKEQIEDLRTQEPRTMAARYSSNAGQVIASSTTPSIIDFEDVVFDPHSLVTTGASWKFTASVGGYYAVAASVIFDASIAWAALERGTLSIYKNGAVYSRLGYNNNFVSAGSSVYMHLIGSDLVYLAATDYIDIRVAQATGGDLALNADGTFNYAAVWKV